MGELTRDETLTLIFVHGPSTMSYTYVQQYRTTVQVLNIGLPLLQDQPQAQGYVHKDKYIIFPSQQLLK